MIRPEKEIKGQCSEGTQNYHYSHMVIVYPEKPIESLKILRNFARP